MDRKRDERVRMEEGDCWYINANRMHRVSNFGKTDRIHLVIDCVVNEWLKNIFLTGETVIANEKDNDDIVKTNNQLQPDDIFKIVHELRLQNTETSNRLADDLLKRQL